MDGHVHHDGSRPTRWSSINQWLLWIGLAAAVAWLYLRHNAHLLQLLPFLFVLACPLMHLFGHHGHGRHGAHGDRRAGGQAGAADRPDDTARGPVH